MTITGLFGLLLPGVSWSYAVFNSKEKENKIFLTPLAGNAIRTIVEAGYARGERKTEAEETAHRNFFLAFSSSSSSNFESEIDEADRENKVVPAYYFLFLFFDSFAEDKDFSSYPLTCLWLKSGITLSSLIVVAHEPVLIEYFLWIGVSVQGRQDGVNQSQSTQR